MSAHANAAVAFALPVAAIAVASFVLTGYATPTIVVLVLGLPLAVVLGRRYVRPVDVLLICVALAALLAVISVIALAVDIGAHGGFE